MFNPHLSTFVRAVDCGSFTKAADQLFISPTAVMKQVNLLEAHLKLKLIQRDVARDSPDAGGRGDLSRRQIPV